VKRNVLYFLSLAALLLCSSSFWAQTAPRESTITVHVGKAGMFSGFGHNHTVVAPVERIVVDEPGMKAELTVLARKLKVVDREVSEKDRAEIQATMLGPKVLDSERFPEIRFQTSRVQKTGENVYRVSGFLELHGVRKEVAFDVTGGPQHYRGKTKLKQTDFGIQPVSVAGGTVKVKDELELEFDIYPQVSPSALGESRK
jgi:YceI-like protein